MVKLIRIRLHVVLGRAAWDNYTRSDEVLTARVNRADRGSKW